MKENDGHYLELMDRIHVLSFSINEHILNHPLCKANKDIKIKINKALKLMMDAYQIVGNK